MTPDQALSILKSEGVKEPYIWDAEPGEEDPWHQHSYDTTLIILEGEIRLTINNQEHILKPGDRFEVPKDVMHDAKVGPGGCKYAVGERK